MNRASAIIATVITALLLGVALQANGAEIKVLSAIAMKNSLDDLAAEFGRATGHKVVIRYGSASVVRKRLEDGEVVDMTILPKPVMEALTTHGKIASDSTVSLVVSTVGVAVRTGDPRPDISTVDAFKRSLLAARTIVYTDPAGGGASGVHFARVLERLGIADDMRPKTKLTTIPGPGPGDVVAKGEAEIAVSQKIDLLPVTGIDFVGPLPSELQNDNDFTYVAGVSATANEAAAANALIRFLSSAVAAPVFKARGMEPVSPSVK